MQAAHASVHRRVPRGREQGARRFCKRGDRGAAGRRAGRFGPRGKPTGALPARPALAVLVAAARNSVETSALRSCSTPWPSARAATAPGERLVTNARVGALFRDHARKYGHASAWASARSSSALVGVCLTWVEEGTHAIEGEPVLRSEHARARAVRDGARVRGGDPQRGGVAGAGVHARDGARAPRALRALARSTWQQTRIEGAHVVSTVECDDEFWAHLRRAMPAVAAPVVKDTENKTSTGSTGSRAAASIADRASASSWCPGRPRATPRLRSRASTCTTGCCCTSTTSTRRRCTIAGGRRKEEENRNNPNDPWGLPIPSTNSDAWLGLHVLSVRSEWVCLAERIGAYGVGTPGARAPQRTWTGTCCAWSSTSCPSTRSLSRARLRCPRDGTWPCRFRTTIPWRPPTRRWTRQSIIRTARRRSRKRRAPPCRRFGLVKHASQALPEDQALANASACPSAAPSGSATCTSVTQSDFPAPHLTASCARPSRSSIATSRSRPPLRCSPKSARTTSGCSARSARSRAASPSSRASWPAAEAPASPKRAKSEPVDKSPRRHARGSSCGRSSSGWGAFEKDAVTLEAPIEKGKVVALLLAIQRARAGRRSSRTRPRPRPRPSRRRGGSRRAQLRGAHQARVLETEARLSRVQPARLRVAGRDRAVQFERVTDVNDQEGVRWGLVPVDDFERSLAATSRCASWSSTARPGS